MEPGGYFGKEMKIKNAGCWLTYGEEQTFTKLSSLNNNNHVLYVPASADVGRCSRQAGLCTSAGPRFSYISVGQCCGQQEHPHVASSRDLGSLKYSGRALQQVGREGGREKRREKEGEGLLSLSKMFSRFVHL